VKLDPTILADLAISDTQELRSSDADAARSDAA
jgi:hypothetical protein